jgi:undecaprenyl diphosphate synthase
MTIKIPHHVAIVMDGNGRWAQQRGLPRTAGHEAGESALFDVVEGAIEFGVKEISAYAFSTENWRRSPDEVKFLMGFNRDVIRRRRDQMNEMGVRIRWVGRPKRLWSTVIKELEEAEELTKKNKVLTLNMCVNYGGRSEIVDAAAELARDVKRGKIKADAITEKVFAKYLDSPQMSDVDLIPAFIGGAAHQQLLAMAKRLRRICFYGCAVARCHAQNFVESDRRVFIQRSKIREGLSFSTLNKFRRSRLYDPRRGIQTLQP